MFQYTHCPLTVCINLTHITVKNVSINNFHTLIDSIENWL